MGREGGGVQARDTCWNRFNAGAHRSNDQAPAQSAYHTSTMAFYQKTSCPSNEVTVRALPA